MVKSILSQKQEKDNAMLDLVKFGKAHLDKVRGELQLWSGNKFVTIEVIEDSCGCDHTTVVLRPTGYSIGGLIVAHYDDHHNEREAKRIIELIGPELLQLLWRESFFESPFVTTVAITNNPNTGEGEVLLIHPMYDSDMYWDPLELKFLEVAA